MMDVYACGCVVIEVCDSDPFEFVAIVNSTFCQRNKPQRRNDQTTEERKKRKGNR